MSPAGPAREASAVVDLSSLGAQTGRVWTRREALTLLTPGAVRANLRDGRWQVPWPGVSAGAGAELSAEQRCWAAVLASGGVGAPVPLDGLEAGTGQRREASWAVCGRTAARYWRIPLVDDDDPATEAEEHRHDDISGSRHLADLHHAGRVLHRRRLRLSAHDLVRTGTGLQITSPLRTLVDCVGLLTPAAAVCAIDGALHQHLVSKEDLQAAVRMRSGSGQRWSMQHRGRLRMRCRRCSTLGSARTKQAWPWRPRTKNWGLAPRSTRWSGWHCARHRRRSWQS